MKCSELIRKLQRAGWHCVRQSGSHMVMVHPEKDFQVIIPNHGAKELGKGLTSKILKLADLK